MRRVIRQGKLCEGGEEKEIRRNERKDRNSHKYSVWVIEMALKHPQIEAIHARGQWSLPRQFYEAPIIQSNRAKL